MIINGKVKEKLKPVRKFLVAPLMILGIWTAYLAAFPQRSDTSAMEEQLLEWVNEERTARHLKPVRISSDLRAVATKHSKDMASQKDLSHISSDGKSYLGRLVEAGLFFVDIGENVAVGDTFDAAFIHQKLMESLEHRENILNPKYDTVGIGVVYSKDRRYFVTQDFAQSLEKLNTDEAEEFIRNEINEIRNSSALPPLSFHNIASKFARRYSRNKATGNQLQNIGVLLGETHIHFITTPVLNIPENIARKIASEIYELGAVGAWFGRLEDYPGGAYLITIFLFPRSPYEHMTEKDFSEILLDAMNVKRGKMGLGLIKLDKKQSRYASNISRNLKSQRTISNSLRDRPMNRQVISYVTEEPSMWPANLDPIITDPGLRRIGIGISSQKNKQNSGQTFWITLIF
jgi:uncharacterized protein YkwD